MLTSPMNKAVVIFNGPPGSGKDFICQRLLSDYEDRNELIYHHEFKSRLYHLTSSIYGVLPKRFFEIYDDRNLKDAPFYIFGGLSIRQAMIKVSEDAIKPCFGRDYFGKVAADGLCNGLNVFSDGGFIEELEPIYKATNGQMIIIRLSADGCNFKNDSRNYINVFKDVPIIDVHNDKTSNFVNECKEIINKYLTKELINDEEFYYKISR